MSNGVVIQSVLGIPGYSPSPRRGIAWPPRPTWIGLQLAVELEAVVAALTADPALLHPSERRAQVADVLGVDPDEPAVDRLGDAVGARDVLRPDVAGEPVLGRVGELDRLLLGRRTASPRGPARRSPRWKTRIAGVTSAKTVASRKFPRSSLVGRLPPASRRAPSASAESRKPRTRSWCSERMSGPSSVASSNGIAHADLPGARRDRLHEVLVHRLLDEQARAGRAALAVEREDLGHDGVDGPVEVRVREHDHRRLAAELEGEPLERRSGVRHDRSSPSPTRR